MPFLVSLLLILPGALAGTEQDPEVSDVPDYDDPTLDLLAAWFEPHPKGVLFTVKVAKAELIPANKYYAVSFDFQGNRAAAVVAFDAEGKVHTDLRRPGTFSDDGPTGLANALVEADYELGTPASFWAVIPYEALPGLGDGKVLVDIYGGTGTWSSRSGWDDKDGRMTSNTYIVDETLLPTVVRRNGLAFATAGILFGGVVAGAVAWQVHKRRAATPPPPPPARPTEPPASPGLGLDPRR